MWFFKKKPPPPPPIYKRRPIATIAVLLTMVSMFVLGPIGIIFNGLTENLKKKANNETLLLYMEQQKETNDRQWKAIEQQIQVPQQKTMSGFIVAKPPLSPEEFQQYMKMSPTDKTAFRKLHPAYESLPK